MKKNIAKAIVVLAAIFTLSFILTSCAVKQQLKRADAVIEQVRQDNPDYFYDILVEGDEYQEYVTNK